MSFFKRALIPVWIAFAAVGLAKPPESAAEFLKWSMQKHAELQSYRSVSSIECEAPYSTVFAVQKFTPESKPIQRTMTFEKPNRLHVEVDIAPLGFKAVSASDGQTLLNFTSPKMFSEIYQPAPRTPLDFPYLPAALSQEMSSGANGELMLVRFFAGPEAYSSVVNLRQGEVSYGEPETLKNGEAARVVKFYGFGLFGNVEALISEKSGMVHRLRYDMAPARETMRHMLPGIKDLEKMGQGFGEEEEEGQGEGGAEEEEQKSTAAEEENPGEGIDEFLAMMEQLFIVETFDTIELNPKVEAATFAPAVPTEYMNLLQLTGALLAGMMGGLMGELSGEGSPLPLGEEAPDFELSTLDGKRVKLSDYRGKPVLLYFWETWDDESRDWMPEILKLEALYKSQGLTVLTLSTDGDELIREALEELDLNPTVLLDDDADVLDLYNGSYTPSLVFVDAKGVLVEYLIGHQEPATVDTALAKLGLELKSPKPIAPKGGSTELAGLRSLLPYGRSVRASAAL